MGRILHRKGESGIATTYISRKQALKRLQLSLKDFRRLCILKGIYPVEPSHKKKANKNNSTNKTYYYLKDVQFLAHEPLINKFRDFKVFIRKLKKAIGKQDQENSRRLREKEPTYKLDHIVKERYPTFIDAVRDIDDVLSMCFLFSTFPKDRVVKPELIHLCRRLTVEFLHYVIETRALRKVFISIKGIYYQVEIMGQTITWMVPHSLGYARPYDVDFKIMVTFALFYSTMLGFVNFKLYNSINLLYPPKLAVSNAQDEGLMEGEEDITEYIATLNLSLKSSVENSGEDEVQLDEFPDTDEDLKAHKMTQEKLKKFKKLFSGCKIFLNREVPKESLVFIIRCFGGEVSFDKTVHVGATFDESDETITHQIVDRPNVNTEYLSRYYIQPQWVYDSVNAMMLLPVDLYFPGVKLPPHLSPFVEEKEGDYVPPEKQALLDLQQGVTKTLRRVEEASDNESSEDDSDGEVSDEDVGVAGSDEDNPKKRKHEEDEPPKPKVTPGKTFKEDPGKVAQREAAEEKRLAIMMMHKKDKHLYEKIVYGQRRKNREALKLKEKRDEYEKQAKKSKKRVK